MLKSKRATIGGVPSAKKSRNSKSFRKSSASGSRQFRKSAMPTTNSFRNSTSPAWRKSKRNTVSGATKKYRNSKRHSLGFLSEDSISSTSMIKKCAFLPHYANYYNSNCSTYV